MGRIKKMIEVDGQNCWTIFDTGARNNYIIKDIANNLTKIELKKGQFVNLGGKTHTVFQECVMNSIIEEKSVLGLARILDEIGIDEEGRKIEVLIGALTMQEWGIIPVPEKETIDMTHYPKEFVEF